MKTIKIKDYEVILQHVQALPSGYGHKKITAVLEYEGECEQFRRTTSNMPAYDAAMDIEDYEEKQLALFEIIRNDIEDDILDWIELEPA